MGNAPAVHAAPVAPDAAADEARAELAAYKVAAFAASENAAEAADEAAARIDSLHHTSTAVRLGAAAAEAVYDVPLQVRATATGIPPPARALRLTPSPWQNFPRALVAKLTEVLLCQHASLLVPAGTVDDDTTLTAVDCTGAIAGQEYTVQVSSAGVAGRLMAEGGGASKVLFVEPETDAADATDEEDEGLLGHGDAPPGARGPFFSLLAVPVTDSQSGRTIGVLRAGNKMLPGADGKPPKAPERTTATGFDDTDVAVAEHLAACVAVLLRAKRELAASAREAKLSDAVLDIVRSVQDDASAGMLFG